MLGAAALLVVVAFSVACAGARGSGPVTVLGAASLVDVLPRVDPAARHSFAGSDTLVAQVREGAPADVVATADVRLVRRLHGEGLVDRPRVFATNRLVLLVPRGNPARVAGVGDLDRPGVVFVMADAGVPAGDSARRLLAALGRADLVGAAASQEPDVRAVTQKVALGEADAGFAYATDAAATADVVAIGVPDTAVPPIEYGVAVLRDSPRREAAAAHIARLAGPEGRAVLARAGFGPP
jgi:molybdate transport system substrate-binding protein